MTNDKYDPKAIESKWQDKWKTDQTYRTNETAEKPKYYVLDMFPYPSGEGLHVGHPKGYIATDVVSRMKRMQGFNVLHPMGFDAFGLPAEQYAIKMKVNPVAAVEKNVARYKKQLEILGFDYDWSREVNTTDPKYYKWTQWIFLKLLEKGLAEERYEPINWCPVDKTGLSNEDIEDGKCERCGAVVEKRLMKQWVLKITEYADRLLADLDAKDAEGKPLLDWPESIKESQRNWIGRSEGAEINFVIDGHLSTPTMSGIVTVFTTRADTLFGVTYIVLAPEAKIVQELLEKASNKDEVQAYIESAKTKTEIDRTDATKEKTGVEMKDVRVINPATGEAVPVWVADYVLSDYGTGAVMAVPAYDERDAQFAKVYNLPTKEIILEDKEEIIKKFGKKVVKYKLREWVFSRQRYWGEPIPVLHRVGVSEDSALSAKMPISPISPNDLPLELPLVEQYEPTDNGESPLANISEWVNVEIDGVKYRRETNTMPQWAGSSWYYLRYMDPHNDSKLVDPSREKYWNSVDLYVGGAEHATRHLIYARFWHKFLYDIGVVSTIEPFKKLQSVGLIMASDGRKMSKRWGNVINPDEMVDTFGADSMRLYEMFMGPFDQAISWNTNGVVGTRRFIEKVWRLSKKIHEGAKKTAYESMVHKTIKKVTEDIELLKFNTAVSTLMILVNDLEKEEEVAREDFEILLKLLAPFAPHVAEELWQECGHDTSIHLESWPVHDSSKIIDDVVNIAVQVNGKTREVLTTMKDLTEDAVVKAVLELPGVQKWVEDKPIKRVIWVKNRILNLIID